MTSSKAENISQRIIFITDQLGLYHAELARVLHLHCRDIGELTAGRTLLVAGSQAWQRAEALVRFYDLLETRLEADEVAMYHWLRAENSKLGGTPLLLIVDEDRLEEVNAYLEASLVINHSHQRR